MLKRNGGKLLLAALFLIITVVFIVLENETIFPASLVAFLLVLTRLGKGTGSDPAGKASRASIMTFSVLVIILNVLVPLCLPMVLSGVDFSHQNFEMTTSIGTHDATALKEHFIGVTNNDMHELCYSTSILLIFNLMFTGVFNLGKSRSAAVVKA